MAKYKIIGADLVEYGPVSAEQVRQWIAEGRVNSETKLQAEGTAEWKPLAEVPEFAAASPALPRFLHTCCQHCSGPIEFPEHGLETEISCPHCETMIRLREGSSPRARGQRHLPFAEQSLGSGCETGCSISWRWSSVVHNSILNLQREPRYQI